MADLRAAASGEQIQAALPPLNTSVGNSTAIHAAQGAVIDIVSFGGFTDFELDLTCLSRPASPTGSVYMDARSCSTSATPTASPRHSLSIHSGHSHANLVPSRRTSPSPRLSPMAVTSIVRGSLPLMRYVGRGTPIDRNRRIEWGTTASEEVSEDGLLFSAIRSTSLDSGVRVNPSRRSISPDWNIVNRRPTTLPVRRRSRASAPEHSTITPAIQIEGLGTEKAGEWASFMQTVLSGGSSEAAPPASTSSAVTSIPSPGRNSGDDEHSRETAPKPINKPTMSPEEIRKLDTGLEMDLGIDAALDLALQYRFDAGAHPTSGRESQSFYSQLSRSPSPIPRPASPPPTTPLDTQSASSTKADTAALESKTGSPSWWRKLLNRLRKAHLFLGSHGH